MILLVPLSTLEIPYVVGSGRPYSKLEALILRAIEQGAGTVDALRETFEVHPRLIIEALVTLTHAGWLAVSSAPGKSFVLTTAGVEALQSGDNPRSLQTWMDETYVFMERLTGSVILSEDINYVRRGNSKVDWENCVKLPPRVTEDVDESKVDPLLPRAQGEWIRSIGSIELKGRELHWLPVTVDLRTGAISGVPDEWRHLHPILLAEAQNWADRLTTGAAAATWRDESTRRSPVRDAREVPPREWPIRLLAQDVLFDHPAHERYLQDVLKRAHSTVFIASAFITIARLEGIRSSLDEALRRPVIIDLLWGYEAEEKVTNWLHNKVMEVKREQWPGRLRFNRRPSGSHAKMILWDHSERQFEGCVGSCNWLSFAPSASGTNTVTEVSVKLSRPGLLAQLSRCAASLYKGLRYDMGGASHRRQQEAAEMERIEVSYPPSGEFNATARLIKDLEHEWSLRSWLSAARQRLVVTSDQLGSVSATRLTAARTRATGFRWTALYGRTTLESDQVSSVAEHVATEGGVLVYVPGLHAKVVVSDEVACVSSYNFLSADPFQTASEARELGIVITGSEPAGWLAHQLSPKLSPQVGA